MVPTAGDERTSVELCAELGGQRDKHRRRWLWRCFVLWGRGAKRTSWSNFLKCCYEAEDEGVQVTTVAMLVLGLASVVNNWFAGSGKQVAVQTEDVAALMPRLAVEETCPTRGPRHEA